MLNYEILLEAYLFYLKNLGKSENTIKQYEKIIKHYLKTHKEITKERVLKYIKKPGKDPKTLESEFYILKRFAEHIGINTKEWKFPFKIERETKIKVILSKEERKKILEKILKEKEWEIALYFYLFTYTGINPRYVKRVKIKDGNVAIEKPREIKIPVPKKILGVFEEGEIIEMPENFSYRVNRIAQGITKKKITLSLLRYTGVYYLSKKVPLKIVRELTHVNPKRHRFSEFSDREVEEYVGKVIE